GRRHRVFVGLGHDDGALGRLRLPAEGGLVDTGRGRRLAGVGHLAGIDGLGRGGGRDPRRGRGRGLRRGRAWGGRPQRGRAGAGAVGDGARTRVHVVPPAEGRRPGRGLGARGRPFGGRSTAGGGRV